MSDIYLTPEQKAREKIDAKLNQAGWKVQSKDRIDFSAGLGTAQGSTISGSRGV